MNAIMKLMRGMNIVRCVLMTVIFIFAGCFTIERDGGESLKEKDIYGKSESASYMVRSITAVRPILTFDGGSYALRLEADGSFVRHDERTITSEVSGRKRVMGVGFFPALLVPNTHEAFKTGPAERIFKVLLFNGGLGGLPTICSLLIEPFREHHLEVSDTTLTDWGLIGCRKYLVSIQPYRKVRR